MKNKEKIKILTHQSMSELLKSYPYPSYERMMYDFKERYPDGMEVSVKILKDDFLDVLGVMDDMMNSIKYHNKVEGDEEIQKEFEYRVKEDRKKLDKMIVEHQKTQRKMRNDHDRLEVAYKAERWCKYLEKIL